MNKNDINRDANLTAEDKEKNENMHDKSDSNNNDEGGVVKEERTDGLQDQTNLLPVKQVIVVFLGISAALFCSLLDQTIVSTALPTISSVFNAGDTSNWVATSYLLTSTAIMPVYSRLSDLIGRKAVLMMCLIIFWLGSLACAVSKTINELIAFRAISGLGGGGILNNSMIIISDVVSLRERGKYQGILGAVVALSNSLGPLLGGVFTDTIGWRWCFYINLPCLGVAIILVQFFLPFKKITGNWREKIVKIDYIGSILVLASTTLILLPLNWGGNKFAWDSAVVIALLIIGILLGVAFVVVENLQKIIPLPILPISASYICTFFSGMIFYGALYYLPQYLQVCAGYSPLKSGVVLLALILTQTIFSFTAGLITSKTGRYRMQIWSGFTVWTVGLGLFITLKPDTPLANFIGYSIIAGVGAGNTFQTTLLSVQAAVARQDMAVATGGRNFIRVLGGTISLALCDAILRNTLIKELNKSGVSENTNIGTILSDPTRIKDLGLSDSVTQEILYDYCIGIRNIFILFTACSGMSFLISLLIRQYSLTRGDEKQLKEEGKQFMQDVKNKKRNKS